MPQEAPNDPASVRFARKKLIDLLRMHIKYRNYDKGFKAICETALDEYLLHMLRHCTGRCQAMRNELLVDCALRWDGLHR